MESKPVKKVVQLDDESEEEDEFEMDSKKLQAQDMKRKKYPGENDQEYDDILSSIFEKVKPGEGDEFAAVKPWLGAIKEPKNHNKPKKDAPDDDYAIDWVHGYRSEEARMNCQFNSAGQAVYPAAAIGVIYDYNQMTQTYFGGGKTEKGGRKQLDESKDIHTDDITALCLSNSRKLVASGQNGQKPLIFLWDALTGEVKCKKRVPKGGRLVTAIGISCNEQFICATDASEKISAHVFKVDGSVNPIASVEINMKVVHLAWNPFDESLFATAGKDHVILCSVNGKTIKKQKGKSKSGKIASQCSAAWSMSPGHKSELFTGGSDGQIYHWMNDQIQKQYPNNKGSVHSIACREADGAELVLAGGNDKSLTVYAFKDTLSKMWSFTCEGAPRSIDLFNGRLLLGLKTGQVVDIAYKADGKLKPKTVMRTHCDGEVWGLEAIEYDGGNLIITTADDNQILAYDVKTHQAVGYGQVADLGKRKKGKVVKAKRGGASTMSSFAPDCQSRAIAYCKELGHLAVATNMGVVTIREIDWGKVEKKDSDAFNTVKKTLFKDLKKAEWIECMSYSPCGKYLAVGSHDNTIYLLDTKTYKKTVKLTGHSSFITAIDWSLDSKYIRTVCGAYELLFFNIGTKKRDPSGASNTVEQVWRDQTCKFGWTVQGIFPSGADGSFINRVAMDKNQKMIATADDSGMLQIYRNPCLEGHASSKYRGHSEHVTNVKFSDCGKYIFTTGGQDQCTIQWKKKKN